MGRRKYRFIICGLVLVLLLSLYMFWYYVIITRTELGYLDRAIMQYGENTSSAGLSPWPEDILGELARKPGTSYITTRLLNKILEPAHDAKLKLTRSENIDLVPDSWRPPNRITFIIMGGSNQKGRIPGKKDSYMKWTQANYLIFSDESNEDLGMMTLPEIQGKSNYSAAQYRQFYGMKYIIANRSDLMQNTSWFILGDDDTWFNVPALTSFLSQYDPELLVAFGYVWADMFIPGAQLSGGAGMVLSRAAMELVARDILTSKCPFDSSNDLTLSHCCVKNGIIKVHDTRFHFRGPMNTLSDQHFIHRNDVISQFSYHYINDVKHLHQITCYAAEAWQMMPPDLNCTVYSKEMKDFRSNLLSLMAWLKRLVN